MISYIVLSWTFTIEISLLNVKHSPLLFMVVLTQILMTILRFVACKCSCSDISLSRGTTLPGAATGNIYKQICQISYTTNIISLQHAVLHSRGLLGLCFTMSRSISKSSLVSRVLVQLNLWSLKWLFYPSEISGLSSQDFQSLLNLLAISKLDKNQIY